MKIVAALATLLACAATAALAAAALQNVNARAGLTLNGTWRVIVDPYENGFYNYRRDAFDAAPKPTNGYFLDHKPADRTELVEYDFDSSPTLMVPGDWNSQDDKLFWYEGSVWYRTTFDYAAEDGARQVLHFGGANYHADVYRIRWTFGYDEPVVISESGADALPGKHGDRLTRFSEEYQEDLYKQTLVMLAKIPPWRGTTPWILTDFRSPRRPLPNIQDGWNRKGEIGENGAKKKAFFVLQDFYRA